MKDYIMDEGRVSACDTNISKMNLIEYMWYMRYILYGNIVTAIEEAIDNLYVIVNLLPIYYPYMAIMHIRFAKKAVIEYAMAKDKETPP